MLPFKLIIEIIWSDNIFLPKASIIKNRLNFDGSFYSATKDDSKGNFTYRLIPKLVFKNKVTT